jgi:hypothetical protein
VSKEEIVQTRNTTLELTLFSRAGSEVLTIPSAASNKNLFISRLKIKQG